MGTGIVARRYVHDNDDRDPLSIAVAAVAHWLADQRLDLQWIVTAAGGTVKVAS